MRDTIITATIILVFVAVLAYVAYFMHFALTTHYELVCENDHGEVVVNVEAWNISADSGYVVAHTDDGILYLDYRCTSTRVENE